MKNIHIILSQIENQNLQIHRLHRLSNIIQNNRRQLLNITPKITLHPMVQKNITLSQSVKISLPIFQSCYPPVKLKSINITNILQRQQVFNLLLHYLENTRKQRTLLLKNLFESPVRL